MLSIVCVYACSCYHHPHHHQRLVCFCRHRRRRLLQPTICLRRLTSLSMVNQFTWRISIACNLLSFWMILSFISSPSIFFVVIIWSLIEFSSSILNYGWSWWLQESLMPNTSVKRYRKRTESTSSNSIISSSQLTLCTIIGTSWLSSSTIPTILAQSYRWIQSKKGKMDTRTIIRPFFVSWTQ